MKMYYYSIFYFQRKPKPTKEVITIGIYEGEHDPEDYNDLLWKNGCSMKKKDFPTSIANKLFLLFQ